MDDRLIALSPNPCQSRNKKVDGGSDHYFVAYGSGFPLYFHPVPTSGKDKNRPVC